MLQNAKICKSTRSTSLTFASLAVASRSSLLTLLARPDPYSSELPLASRTGNVGRSKVLRSADLFALFSSPVAQSMSLSTVGLTLSNWTSSTFSHCKIDWKKRSSLSWGEIICSPFYSSMGTFPVCPADVLVFHYRLRLMTRMTMTTEGEIKVCLFW